MKIKNPESNVCCGYSEVLDCSDEVLKDIHSDIKVFKIELPQYDSIIEVLVKVLSPDEVKRANRYRQLKDSNRFIICRALLKILMAEAKGLDVSEIYFEKEENHKPYFPLDRSLFFNVSHAGNFALIAIGNCELGVDVEHIDENFYYSDILSTVFSNEEIRFISDSEFQRHTFYKFWTRKEAIVKATGKGIDDEFLKIPVRDGSHLVSSSLVQDFKNVNVYSFNLNASYIGSIACTEQYKILHFYPPPKPEALITLLKV